MNIVQRQFRHRYNSSIKFTMHSTERGRRIFSPHQSREGRSFDRAGQHAIRFALMYFNCGWPARRARVSQVNQPVGEISCASRNRVSRDSSWTLPRASLLSYPAAAPVPFSLDTRHLIKKQNDSRASPRSTLLAFQTIIPETATGVRVSESLLPRLSGGALLLWRKETRRGF